MILESPTLLSCNLTLSVGLFLKKRFHGGHLHYIDLYFVSYFHKKQTWKEEDRLNFPLSYFVVNI